MAVINNSVDSISQNYICMNLKMSGSKIHFPFINKSEHFTSITSDDVYISFRHIESLESKLIEAILEIRQHGPFVHLQDFIERVCPGIEQLNRLINIGAFRFTGKNKKELLWEANFLQSD